MAAASRARNVFLNCPFDKRYRKLSDAIVFAIVSCGYDVRSALEIADSGDLRLAKIMRLLSESRFSIHDISRVELDPGSGLPRFNMPIELGAALGMKHLGRSSLRNHGVLVLDTERYRYQKFASDLAGTDIHEHQDRPERCIKAVRDFLVTHDSAHLPGAGAIYKAYRAFQSELPAMARTAGQRISELTHIDRLRHIAAYLARSQP